MTWLQINLRNQQLEFKGVKSKTFDPGIAATFRWSYTVNPGGQKRPARVTYFWETAKRQRRINRHAKWCNSYHTWLYGQVPSSSGITYKDGGGHIEPSVSTRYRRWWWEEVGTFICAAFKNKKEREQYVRWRYGAAQLPRISAPWTASSPHLRAVNSARSLRNDWWCGGCAERLLPHPETQNTSFLPPSA